MRTTSPRPRRLLLSLAVTLGAAAGALAPAALAAAYSGPSSVAVASAANPLGAALTSTDAMSAADADAALESARTALRAAAAVTADAAVAGVDLGVAADIDTAPLRAATEDLRDAPTVPLLLFPEVGEAAEAEARAVTTQVADARLVLVAALAQKGADEVAAEAQRLAEEAAAAEAQRRAEALAAVNAPDGAKAHAAQLAAERYGWGADQFSCLSFLWQKESNWNYRAYNSSSGATGIPQALPGSKMASFGGDWAENAATQIAWGLDYIDRAYGSPCGAWSHSQATNWY